MKRLTEWTGYEWIPVQERVDGKIIGNKTCLQRLAEYENTGLEPEEIVTVMSLAEKMNVCDLVRENIKLSNTIQHLKADLKAVR